MPFDGGKCIDFEESFMSEGSFILCDDESIPNLTILHDIVIGMQSKMGEDGFSKGSRTCQKVL